MNAAALLSCSQRLLWERFTDLNAANWKIPAIYEKLEGRRGARVYTTPAYFEGLEWPEWGALFFLERTFRASHECFAGTVELRHQAPPYSWTPVLPTFEHCEEMSLRAARDSIFRSFAHEATAHAIWDSVKNAIHILRIYWDGNDEFLMVQHEGSWCVVHIWS